MIPHLVYDQLVILVLLRKNHARSSAGTWCEKRPVYSDTNTGLGGLAAAQRVFRGILDSDDLTICLIDS